MGLKICYEVKYVCDCGYCEYDGETRTNAITIGVNTAGIYELDMTSHISEPANSSVKLYLSDADLAHLTSFLSDLKE